MSGASEKVTGRTIPYRATVHFVFAARDEADAASAWWDEMERAMDEVAATFFSSGSISPMDRDDVIDGSPLDVFIKAEERSA